ncbi:MULTISPECIES: hypothetical protein [Enterobacteriaceae]|uniref:hypothetical protein n=1 Tax=Enterobacteriaceae TaxID=543 RepID=UPI00038F55D1|nr:MULTISPECIES: hypothetical protein [Enterobacteriaceae]EHK6185312.1 hypothetical protein [Escherichia coli]EHL6306159.1 hypothetical protein [Escherichia coli]EHN3569161.1 hypothetical protein [Escherichia coli]EHO7042603.1 hypothetical protein [Escherichia coli]EHO7091660.1 hypothetical protein [Escherichia coli]
MSKDKSLTQQVAEILSKQKVSEQGKMIQSLKNKGLINKPVFTLAYGPDTTVCQMHQ